MDQTTSPTTIELRPAGAFSLEESATFGFGQRHLDHFDGVLRLAFCTDGTWEPAGVEVTQSGPVVAVRVIGGEPGAAVRQVARVLSLDHDSSGFDALGAADPIVGRVLAVAPGLRPPLFHSPYEAAAWSVLSARRPARQMMEVRRALSAAHGTSFELAGRTEVAWPTPEQLLGVAAWPGLTPVKIERLHGVARAALDGLLDVDRLVAMGPEAATADLQRLAGIGPFYASLIVIRACGFADVPVDHEPRLLATVGKLYGLGRPADAADMARINEAWRPWRTWTSVLLRAAAGRLPQAS